MRYAHLAPHVARDAVRLLDRAPVPASDPNPPGNSAPQSPGHPGDPVEVAKDGRKFSGRRPNQLRSFALSRAIHPSARRVARWRPSRPRIHATSFYSFGPPARTSADACASYFLKFSRNSDATRFAFSS
jgi:hypothetical protein